MNFRGRLAAFVAVLMLAACARNPFGAGEDKDSVLFRIGSVFLTRSELESRMLELGTDYARYLRTPQGKQALLTALARQKLLVRVAVDRGLDKEQLLREEWIRLRREQENALRLYRENLLIDALVERMRGHELQVTDGEIANYYKEHQKLYRVRHILVADKKTAEEIAGQLKKTKSNLAGEFTRLTRLHSLEAQSAREGGKITPFLEGELEEPFERAAMSLASGQVSEPVQTKVGVHLILMEGTSLALFADEIRSRCRRILEKKKLDALIEIWKSKYVMEVRDETLRPFLSL